MLFKVVIFHFLPFSKAINQGMKTAYFDEYKIKNQFLNYNYTVVV